MFYTERGLSVASNLFLYPIIFVIISIIIVVVIIIIIIIIIIITFLIYSFNDFYS